MAYSFDELAERERRRWMKPNAHLYMRPDAQRFMRPDAARFVHPDQMRFNPLVRRASRNLFPHRRGPMRGRRRLFARRLMRADHDSSARPPRRPVSARQTARS